MNLRIILDGTCSMSNRRNNALILKHHPLRFRFEDHFLGKHVLRSNFIPSSPHVGLRVGTTQCRSASDSLQKGAELFFPAPNRLFFFHLLFISPMNMLFRGVVPPLHNLENWGKWTHFIKKGIKKSAPAKKASAGLSQILCKRES